MADAGEMKGQKLKVFISYSRRDLELADQLAAVLEWQGFNVIIDRKGIHGAENWESRLGQLILEADTVIFVLSPDSAASEICKWEVEEAARRSKRIVPILCRQLNDVKPHQILRDLNYIHFYPEKDYPGSGFGTGLMKLTEVLKADISWLREHTRLEELAAHWEANRRISDLLVRGSELAAYRSWRARKPGDAPDLTALQRAFLSASEEEEIARASAERKRLDDMAAAQAERQNALDEAQAALTREAEAQAARARFRRIIQWGSGGFAVVTVAAALSFAAIENKNATKQKELTERAELVLSELIDVLPKGWPSDDLRSPDYRHIAGIAEGKESVAGTFELTAQAVEVLLAWNSFSPIALNGKIVLVLRGAELLGPAQLESSLKLRDVRPDHQSLRSVFIVYDRAAQRLTAFPGATEPNISALRSYLRNKKGFNGAWSHLLPTGAFTYQIGIYLQSKSVERQRPGSLVEYGRMKLVRRTANDLSFDVWDEWETNKPVGSAVALCGRGSEKGQEFSSYGTLCLMGSIEGELNKRNYTGPIAGFRAALDLDARNLGADDGKEVDVVLLTGLEAAVASRYSAANGAGDPKQARHLFRLRQGSKGEFVRRLQAGLGLEPTGIFDWQTALALVERQQKQLGWSDAIISPEVERQLSLCVFDMETCPQRLVPESR